MDREILSQESFLTFICAVSSVIIRATDAGPEIMNPKKYDKHPTECVLKKRQELSLILFTKVVPPSKKTAHERVAISRLS